MMNDVDDRLTPLMAHSHLILLYNFPQLSSKYFSLSKYLYNCFLFISSQTIKIYYLNKKFTAIFSFVYSDFMAESLRLEQVLFELIFFCFLWLY